MKMREEGGLFYIYVALRFNWSWLNKEIIIRNSQLMTLPAQSLIYVISDNPSLNLECSNLTESILYERFIDMQSPELEMN